jgi:hypothetical protein
MLVKIFLIIISLLYFIFLNKKVSFRASNQLTGEWSLSKHFPHALFKKYAVIDNLFDS